MTEGTRPVFVLFDFPAVTLALPVFRGHLAAGRGCRAMPLISARSNGRDWTRNSRIWSNGKENSVSSMLKISPVASDE
jgi:hypothetical protein